ncbi:hypothetical protein [Mongoliitalea daihaiensis]|uniref:hypothetical protein n=1 Tax=Mongoliitalea daihaiensis TaxID=2782006 RepID=UPI001F32CDDE|nr:hypothetical protein [Mongoliitalea daihaiensis]UJP64158.1 hypothetical protein IPZ59_15255 [Mongoliitalea daihaiensis]
MKITSSYIVYSWTSLIAALIIIILAIPRGLDFSDEGLYLLMTVPSQENIQRLLNYDLFFKVWHKLTDREFSMQELRVIRLIVCLITWATFAKILKILHKLHQSWQTPVLGLSVLISYTFLPQSLSYNHLTVMLGVSLLLFFIRWIHYQSISFVQILLVGILLALLLYVKAPAALALGILSSLLIYRIKPNLYLYIPALLIPFILFEFYLFVYLGESRFWELFKSLGLGDRLTHYSMVHLTKTLLIGGLWFGLSFISGRFLAGKFLIFNLTLLNVVLALIFISLIAFITLVVNEITIVFMVFFIALLGYLSPDRYWMPTKTYVSYFILLLFPWMLHTGSNVYFLRLAIHYLPFWMLLVLLWSDTTPQLKPFFKVVFPMVSLVLLVWCLWLFPFRQESLFNQKVPYYISDNNRVFLDEPKVDFLTTVKEHMNKYDIQNGQVLAFFENPGIMYALGLTHPMVPGIWDEKQLQLLPIDWDEYNLIIYAAQNHPIVSIKGSFEKMATYTVANETYELWIRANDSFK